MVTRQKIEEFLDCDELVAHGKLRKSAADFSELAGAVTNTASNVFNSQAPERSPQR